METTRRQFMQGAVSMMALVATVTELPDVQDGNAEEIGLNLAAGVISVRTVSEEVKYFRIVQEPYTDAFDNECMRPMLERIPESEALRQVTT